MTELEGKSNEDLASWFITSTCQFLPKSFPVVSDLMNDLMMSTQSTPTEYSIMSGSIAEFYIRPLTACISDIDILICNTDELAFSGEIPVLPSDFTGLADEIEMYRIESYHMYPGFVRLRVLGVMKYNWELKTYEFYYTTRTNSCKTINVAELGVECFLDPVCESASLTNSVNGPAITFQSYDSDQYLESDFVRSVWCPQWPNEAINWSFRPRKHNWPTVDTIFKVLQNGCHVVYVQHRSCRDDELQWRFSFSIAEVILIQSWNHIQQIVYHMLRFFAKRELIQKDCSKEDEILCPYHLKTLMLWTCEEMSPEWWNSSSIFAICSKLLQRLSEWLNRRNCPNYFIPEANLFHQLRSSAILFKINRLLSESGKTDHICRWFVKNYIQSFNQKYATRVGLSACFSDFVADLGEFRRTGESKTLDLLLNCTVADCHKGLRFIIKRRLSCGMRQSLRTANYRRCSRNKADSCMAALPVMKNDLCFTFYDKLLHAMHVAYGIDCGEISLNSNLFFEFACAISMEPKIMRSQYHNFPKTFTEQSNRHQFLRAQKFMLYLTGLNSRSEFKLLSLMSKEYLTKSLEYDDSESMDTNSAAYAYLAALHNASSEYQIATSFCLAVLYKPRSQQGKDSLNLGCLLFIDDVARIVGLFLLYKKIPESDLHFYNGRLYLDLRVSPKVFSHYVLCDVRISQRFYFRHETPHSVFPFDDYLKALTKQKFSVSNKSANCRGRMLNCRGETVAKADPAIENSLTFENAVINILMEFALENMASFYSVILKDFGIQCSIVVDCYRALYCYKCNQYKEALHLCQEILQEPVLEKNLKEFSFANILLLPPLDFIFDRDVQSLLGFHTLFNYLSPVIEDMWKLEQAVKSTFVYFFARSVYFQGNELSNALVERYPIKCHYFLGRQFLARYLKVRCCIDCDLTYSDVVNEFAAHKARLPFEHVIHRFLLQKLRSLKKSQ